MRTEEEDASGVLQGLSVRGPRVLEQFCNGNCSNATIPAAWSSIFVVNVERLHLHSRKYLTNQFTGYSSFT